jgi:serine/threonine protein phosphatase PrpC
MKFSIYQRSEQGGRKANEDRMGYTYTRESALFVIADGMGGHAHGELAAQIALETLTECFKKQAQPKLASPPAFLSQSMLLAHHQILQFSHEHGMADSPRTTAVALIVQDGQAWWAHCGDSRLYWIRESALMKRTIDHSYVEQPPPSMKPNGDSSATYLAKMANRNVLFTCLGSPTKPIYDVSAALPLKHRDRFLLCSDGLWAHYTDQEMTSLFVTDVISHSTSFLIDLALKRGGHHCDNVTAIGMEWEDAPSSLDSHANLVTDSLGPNVFASTVQHHLVDPVSDTSIQMNDLDIEHSLKEINEAIQKSISK